MRTGISFPISNNALGIAFLLAIAFFIVVGIFKIIQKATFVEREAIKFADQSPLSLDAAQSGNGSFDQSSGIDLDSLALPSVQEASAFFSHIAPRVGLNIEINRTKNTLLFSNSESAEHRLVIAITGSGRYAAAYYATRISRLTSEPRLTFKAGEDFFVLKASAESLIFRDQGESFYEISPSTLTAMACPHGREFRIEVSGSQNNMEEVEKKKIEAIAKIIILIAKQRSDIIFLGD